MSLPDQRRVLVTGAARGLGAALVRAFRGAATRCSPPTVRTPPTWTSTST